MTNQEPGQYSSLTEYYLKELEKHLGEIDTAVELIEKNHSSKEAMEQIGSALGAINDLAMIHGQEGVEAIVSKMLSSVVKVPSENLLVTKDLLLKTKSATQAIRQIMHHCDEIQERIIVDTTTAQLLEYSEEPVETVIEPKPQPEIEFESLDLEESPEKVPFDIKEPDELMSLVEEDFSSILASQPKSPVESVDLGQEPEQNIEKQKSEEFSEIEEVFDAIYREETEENLNFLKESIEKLKTGEALGEAIMRVKSSCNALKDSAISFKLNEIKEPLTLLDRLAKEKLVYNLRPSEEVVNVLSEAEEAMRQFLASREVDFQPLSAHLERLLTSKSGESEETDFKGVQEKENVPVEDSKSKKKIKVVSVIDNLRRKWVLKSR